MSRWLKYRAMSAIVALCALIALGSCEHKELCYHHDHTVTLRLVFDWQDAPEASPRGMCVFFYPLDEGLQIRRFDFEGMTGGEITLSAGRYEVVCYNNDTENMRFRGVHSFGLHEMCGRDADLFEPVGAMAPSRLPRAPEADEESIVACPDELWGCNATEVDVTAQGVSYICVPESDKDPWLGDHMHTYADNTITLYPHVLTCVYSYEIRNVKNIEYVLAASASLSGMAPSLFVASENTGREPSTLPLPASLNRDERTITGMFLTFGHHEENVEAHRMMLYVWATDGNRYAFGSTGDHMNVTEQIHSAPDRRRVHMVIDGLEMPSPITGDEGFSPSADEWTQVETDIIM